MTEAGRDPGEQDLSIKQTKKVHGVREGSEGCVELLWFRWKGPGLIFGFGNVEVGDLDKSTSGAEVKTESLIGIGSKENRKTGIGDSQDKQYF